MEPSSELETVHCENGLGGENGLVGENRLESPPIKPSTSRRKFRERRAMKERIGSGEESVGSPEDSPMLSSPDIQNGTSPGSESRMRRSGRSASRSERSAQKEELRKIQGKVALAEADADELRSQNQELVKALERERSLRKEGNRVAAEGIAAAQAEVVALRGQTKGLASKVLQVEAEREAAVQSAKEEHQECLRDLAQLQSWVAQQNLEQEQERSVNEQAIVASRSQRDTLHSEKAEMQSAREAAEQNVAAVTQRVQEAVSNVGQSVRVRLDALVEEIASAEYEEDCSMERLALIGKLAIAARSGMDEGLNLLEEAGKPPEAPAAQAGAAPEAASTGEHDSAGEDALKNWRHMRDTGMITAQEYDELVGKLLPQQAEAERTATQTRIVEKKASKWSWRGGPNKRQEEVASVVRAAQAQMLEELKFSLKDREEAVYELQERLQEVEMERDAALQTSASELSVRSSSHQRSGSFDSCDFGEFESACFSPREYSEEALRLKALNDELCECQETYLTLPKGTQRRELRVKMKELDRQCKHLQAQLSRGPKVPTPTSVNSQDALESALVQAESIANALELMEPLSPHSQQSSPSNSQQSSPCHSQASASGAAPLNGTSDKSKSSASRSTPNSPTHKSITHTNRTLTPRGTTAKEPSNNPWLPVKAALNSVPIMGLAGSKTKAGSLSELIKQRKANKGIARNRSTFSEGSDNDNSPKSPNPHAAALATRHARKMSC